MVHLEHISMIVYYGYMLAMDVCDLAVHIPDRLLHRDKVC